MPLRAMRRGKMIHFSRSGAKYFHPEAIHTNGKEMTMNKRLPMPAVERIGFSPAETAARLGLGLCTIKEALRSGELEGRRIGTRVLIPAAAEARWLENLPRYASRAA
jgi:excisionase family DNA binding protein